MMRKWEREKMRVWETNELRTLYRLLSRFSLQPTQIDISMTAPTSAFSGSLSSYLRYALFVPLDEAKLWKLSDHGAARLLRTVCNSMNLWEAWVSLPTTDFLRGLEAGILIHTLPS